CRGPGAGGAFSPWGASGGCNSGCHGHLRV
ncbi:hypothetical protein AZZ62_005276, partial [Klebsiella variicola]